VLVARVAQVAPAVVAAVGVLYGVFTITKSLTVSFLQPLLANTHRAQGEVVALEHNLDVARARTGMAAAVQVNVITLLLAHSGPVALLAVGLAGQKTRPPLSVLVQEGAGAELRVVQAVAVEVADWYVPATCSPVMEVVAAVAAEAGLVAAVALVGLVAQATQATQATRGLLLRLQPLTAYP